jgi:putative acetyltransferase
MNIKWVMDGGILVVQIWDFIENLEQAVIGTMVVHASITAKPFFQKRGYVVVKGQQVERQGILLTNFVMKK